MASKKDLIVVVKNGWERSEILQSAVKGFSRAQHRVGTDDRQRLKWLLEFAHLPPEKLTQLSEAERTQLRFDLACFAYLPDPSDVPPLEEVAIVANEVRNGIEQLVRTTRWTLRLSGIPSLDRTLEPRPVRRAGRIVALRGFQSIYGSDDFKTAFLLAAADAVEAEGTRIRVCAQKDCRRLFARHRRAKYCSSRCSQKERDFRFRKRHTSSELSNRRHRYYKNWIARERGRATASKVRRRPVTPKSQEPGPVPTRRRK